MKMEKKQCTKCKHFLLFECFRINKRTAQLTKRCVKCLDNEKMYKENRKCEHGNRVRLHSFEKGVSKIFFAILKV